MNQEIIQYYSGENLNMDLQDLQTKIKYICCGDYINISEFLATHLPLVGKVQYADSFALKYSLSDGDYISVVFIRKYGSMCYLESGDKTYRLNKRTLELMGRLK